MLKTPVIVLNMKTYSESTGRNALNIARIMDKVSIESGINMAVSVQSVDIKECSENISIPVFAEHIDPIKPGSHTGWLLPESIKSAVKVAPAFPAPIFTIFIVSNKSYDFSRK